ncbi:hypothetical protein JVI29_002955 [Clostridium perfringens]
MDVYIERRLKSYEDYIRFFYNEIKIKNKRIEELETELQEVKSENKSLKEENRKNSGKINAYWIKAGSKVFSNVLEFEESLDKAREFLESDTEKCDNRYITDYPNFQELIDKDRLKDLETKKVEDLTLNDCIEECLIRLDLGQDKFKDKLFEIDLTRYFHLLYCHRRKQNYVTDSIMDEGYEEVLLNIKPVGIIGYGLKHKVTLKVKIPE